MSYDDSVYEVWFVCGRIAQGNGIGENAGWFYLNFILIVDWLFVCCAFAGWYSAVRDSAWCLPNWQSKCRRY